MMRQAAEQVGYSNRTIGGNLSDERHAGQACPQRCDDPGFATARMNGKDSSLPEFRSPPVTEVALAVQFEPIELTPVHLGLIALRMRELGLERIEQHPPLQPVIEQFGGPPSPPQVRFEFGPPIVRHWFISEERNTLVQLQPDRFIHNWRKVRKGDEYPRYESIRAMFSERLGQFTEFVAAEQLGELAPNQCEVTYVNHVRPSAQWHDASGLAQIVGIAGNSYADGFLPTPEEMRTAARYVMEHQGQPIGRLHINCHTALDLAQNEPVVVINLTARGAPRSPDLDGVLAFMDMGREWVVRGFADLTTPQMHVVWERER